jgi:hypothetical protein
MSRSCCACFATAQTKTQQRSLHFPALSQRNKGRLCTRAYCLAVALPSMLQRAAIMRVRRVFTLEQRRVCHWRIMCNDLRLVGARAAWRRQVALGGSPLSAEGLAKKDTCRSCERDHSHAGCAYAPTADVIRRHV